MNQGGPRNCQGRVILERAIWLQPQLMTTTATESVFYITGSEIFDPMNVILIN